MSNQSTSFRRQAGMLVAAVLSLQEFRDRFEPSGTVLVGNAPEVFARQVKADYDRWSKVVKASGATAD